MTAATWDPTKVSAGFAYLFLAPGGSAIEPMATALGTAWASPWVYTGATAEGWTLGGNKATQQIPIEEQSVPAKTLITSLDITFSADLMEDKPESLLYSLGVGNLTTTAAATGVPGYTTLNLNDVMNDYAVGLDVPNSYGFWDRFFIPHSFSTGDLSVVFRRAEAAKQFGVELHANCRPDQIIIQQVTAAALP